MHSAPRWLGALASMRVLTMHLILTSLVDSATAPRTLAILIVGLLASVLIGAGPQMRAFVRSMPERLRDGRHEAAGIARDPGRASASAEAIARWPRAALSYGLIGLVLAAWAAYALTQPASELRAAELQHTTSIGYVAHGAPSVALPDGTVGPVSAETVARTGGQPPLFSAVLSKIDFGYRYEMRAPKPLNVLGVGGSALRIKAQDGWERTIVLQAAQPVSGPKVTLWFTVDLDTVRLVIAGVERETGSKSGWYDLTVVPVVRLAGEAGGAHLDETYSEEFNLRYDPVRITPDAHLEHSERRAAGARVETPRRAHAFGLSMRWAMARWLAGLGAIIALAGAAALVVVQRADTPIPEAASGPPASGAPQGATPENATQAAPAAAKASEPSRSSVDAEAGALLAASVAPNSNGTPPPERAD